VKKDMRASASPIALNAAAMADEGSAVAFEEVQSNFDKFCLIAGIEALQELLQEEGVRPGSLRKFTVAACTPYWRDGEIGERPVWIAACWRIARHSDPRDKGSVYGVKRGSRSENMACILICTPC
jgi:hypothetical protein